MEEITLNPIICIGNYHIDKKIKELIKVCNSYELKNPTDIQIEIIINKLIPTITDNMKTNLLDYIQGDLRKLESMIGIYNKQNILLKNEIIQNIFQPKTYNEDSKKNNSKSNQQTRRTKQSQSYYELKQIELLLDYCGMKI